MGKFKLIDGIESAGRFTIVDSKDVSYTEEKTVKQVLDEQESVAEQVESNTAAIAENTSEIESQSGKIEAVESAVADLVVAVDNAEHKIETKASHTEVDQIKSDVTGKANQSEVNQIKNDVAGKANQSEVNEIKTTVAGKASAETVSQLQTDMAVQEARMDQLVGTVPAGSADEIADARIMANGITASNLGNAIRTQTSEIKDTTNNLNKSVYKSTYPKVWCASRSGYRMTEAGVTTSDATAELFAYAVVPNETLYVDLQKMPGSGVYQWQTDSNFHSSDTSTLVGKNCISATKGYITAPDGAKYLIVSKAINTPAVVNYVENNIDECKETTSKLRTDVETCIEKKYKNLFDGHSYITGIAIGGSKGAMKLQENSAYASLIEMPIKPGHDYTVLVGNSGPEGGYYWFKIATATQKIVLGNFDGSYQFARTDAYQSAQHFVAGPNDHYAYIQIAKSLRPFVQIVEGLVPSFTTDKYDDYSYNATDSLNIPAIKPEIIIVPVDDKKFNVDVKCHGTGKYLTHVFERKIFNDVVGGNQITTMDIWFPSDIRDENGNKIMQGNANFIHNLAESGHTGYVGAGDGCCVMDEVMFFADGKVIDPSNISENIVCSAFRYTAKVNHYLSDGTASTHTIPTLVNGQPVVESVNTIDYVIEANNRIKHRNRLIVKRDNTKYSECHGAMCCGYYPYFTDVIINNNEFTHNHINSDYSIDKIGDSTLDLSQYNSGGTRINADEVIMFGEKYRITNRMVQTDGRRYGKSNIRPWFPPNVDNRIKIYMMPVLTTRYTDNPSEAEVFNVGDVIDVKVYREIDASD